MKRGYTSQKQKQKNQKISYIDTINDWKKLKWKPKKKEEAPTLKEDPGRRQNTQ